MDTAQNHWKRFLFPAITSSLLFREGLRVSDRNTLEQVLCQYILLFLISANGKPKYELNNYLWNFPTYWKSIITNPKSFTYGALHTLHKEILIDGEAGKNSNLGTETQYEIKYGIIEMCKIFRVQKKVQFQETASWRTAYWTLMKTLL